MAPRWLSSAGLVLVAACFTLSKAAEDEYGSYPTTYPFADETYVPDTDLPDLGKPTRTYDADDNGGYYLHEAILKSMDSQTGPVFYAHNTDSAAFNFADMMCNTLWQITCSVDIPSSNWNCTNRGGFYSASDFPGVMNGKTICTDCCTNYVGKMEYGDDQLDRLSLFESFETGNGCETMVEELYCTVTDGWQFVCLEQYITRTERYISKPCFDSFARYMAQCSLLKAAGVFSYIEGFEPPQYLEQLTNAHTFVIYGIEYTTFDRVCHPYSYYHPDEVADTSTSATMSICIAHLLAATSAVFQLLA